MIQNDDLSDINSYSHLNKFKESWKKFIITDFTFGKL